MTLNPGLSNVSSWMRPIEPMSSSTKVLIFVDRLLSEQDSYPIPATVRCQVLDAWTDATGKEVVRIKTLESTEGITEFVVLKKQLL